MSRTQTLEGVLGTIRSVVRSFGRFRKRWLVLDGLAKFTIVSPGALLVWFLLDWGLESVGWAPPAWPVFVVFVAICALSLWTCARWAIKPQLHRIVAEREAVVIENLHGELDNSLIGSLQLGADVQAAQEAGESVNYSANLVRVLVARTADRLGGIRTKSLVDRSNARRRLAGAAGIAGVIAVCIVFAQGAIMQRGARLIDGYAAIVELMFPVTMDVTPGDLAVVRGRPVTLGVTVNGARRKNVLLHIVDAETNEKLDPLPLTLTDRRTEHTVAKAEGTFTYRFEYGGRMSDEHRIVVEDLPEIKAMNYELTPPAYTAQPMRILTGRVGKLKGLAETGALVNFAASTRLSPEACYVSWQDGARQAIDINGRFGSFAFSIEKPDRISIHLTGYLGKGFEMESPVSFEIEVQPDKRPAIRILFRERDLVKSAGQMPRFRVPWLAKDDFGVEEVKLYLTVTTIKQLTHMGRAKREKTIVKPVRPPRDRAQGRFDDIFKGISPPLASGDKIEIRLEVKDNNTTKTGPGIGRSQTIKILLAEGDRWGVFTQGQYGLGRRRQGFGALDLLASERIGRETNLLQPPVKTDRTEKPLAFNKQPVQANASQGTMLGDEIGRYFEALAGGGRQTVTP